MISYIKWLHSIMVQIFFHRYSITSIKMPIKIPNSGKVAIPKRASKNPANISRLPPHVTWGNINLRKWGQGQVTGTWLTCTPQDKGIYQITVTYYLLLLRIWPNHKILTWSMDCENEVKVRWRVPDWHVHLRWKAYTKYHWPTTPSYWETDLITKT